MLKATKLKYRLFRNQVGVYELKDGRFIRSGLCVGSADLIGWNKDGFFTAIECKSEGGVATDAQVNFLNQVKLAGGIGAIIKSPEELNNL